MREGAEALLNVRRSYQSLVEAMSLRFAALWPATDADGIPAVRLNLVSEGRLREAVSLANPALAEEIAAMTGRAVGAGAGLPAGGPR